MQETSEMWVQSLGQEVPLEKEMATSSSILASKIPMDRGTWLAAAHGGTNSWTDTTEEQKQQFFFNLNLFILIGG